MSYEDEWADSDEAREQITRLEDDLEKAKEALKDVRAKRAQDRKELEKEKKLRKRLETETQTLKDKTNTIRDADIEPGLSRQTEPQEFQILRDENTRLQSAQDLLKSACETLRQDKKILESRIKEHEQTYAKADRDSQRWENYYMDQSNLVGIYKDKSFSLKDRLYTAEQARKRAERALEDVQRKRDAEVGKKRKFAALLMDCGFTKDDFDPNTYKRPVVQIDRGERGNTIVVDD